MGIFSWFGKAVEDVRYVFMYWRDWQRLAGQGAGFGCAENTILFPSRRLPFMMALLWSVIIKIILWRSVLSDRLIWCLISAIDTKRNEMRYDRGLLIFNGCYAIFDNFEDVMWRHLLTPGFLHSPMSEEDRVNLPTLIP